LLNYMYTKENEIDLERLPWFYKEAKAFNS